MLPGLCYHAAWLSPQYTAEAGHNLDTWHKRYQISRGLPTKWTTPHGVGFAVSSEGRGGGASLCASKGSTDTS